MNEPSMRATQWATMEPDLYGGATCDKLVPRWHVYADGDKDSDYIHGTLRLSGRVFPPGTRVTVTEPACPECGELRPLKHPIPKRGPLFRDKCDCGFDWKAWVEAQYS